MHHEPLAFSLPLPNPIGGPAVEVAFAGTAQVHAAAPDPVLGPRLQSILQQTLSSVLGGRLMRNELAMPTLSPSLPHLVPEIVHHANAQLAPQGVQLAGLSLQASVPQHATQPAAAAIAAAPSPFASAASNFTSNVADQVASHVPTGVNVHVGGFKVGVGQGGVNTGGLADQMKEKVKDKLLTYAIVAGVVLLLGCITTGVLAKILLFG
ncbi:MAG: hypothetical protein IT378_23595 [Sandaracinaceae bacterium]|nr:hypothetical protein [Sandaracinaceae bacterium]